MTNTPELPDLVAQLIAIRKHHGISQREVARRMYVTPPLISMFENGKRPMRTNHLLAYANAIGARITIEDNTVNDTSTENWHPVVGFEGFVEVSDQGRVRSVDRVTHISATDRAGAYDRVHRGKLLKQQRHPAGYMYIQLAGGGKIRKNAKVHHVVLEAFVGPRPEGMECCHANDIPDDNRLVNLRWDTPQGNADDRVRSGSGKRTHCPHGHEYTPENTIILKNPAGVKRCRACSRRTAQRVAS